MKTAEDIIFQYCMGMLNPSPDYYAGRGNNVRDLNSSILEMLHGGIKVEISEDAAKAFVNMVHDLKSTNAQTFLKELYKLEKQGWRWYGTVATVRARPLKVNPQNGGVADVQAPIPAIRSATEIVKAFSRVGSTYGHDKEITEAFLSRHKAEINLPSMTGETGETSI